MSTSLAASLSATGSQSSSSSSMSSDSLVSGAKNDSPSRPSVLNVMSLSLVLAHQLKSKGLIHADQHLFLKMRIFQLHCSDPLYLSLARAIENTRTRKPNKNENTSSAAAAQKETDEQDAEATFNDAFFRTLLSVLPSEDEIGTLLEDEQKSKTQAQHTQKRDKHQQKLDDEDDDENEDEDQDQDGDDDEDDAADEEETNFAAKAKQLVKQAKEQLHANGSAANVNSQDTKAAHEKKRGRAEFSSSGVINSLSAPTESVASSSVSSPSSASSLPKKRRSMGVGTDSHSNAAPASASVSVSTSASSSPPPASATSAPSSTRLRSSVGV